MSEYELTDGHLRCGTAVISLTPKEKALLAVMAGAAGRPVSSERLIEAIWGATPVGSESLHRCISTLRAKITPHVTEPFVTSIYGFGYRLNVKIAVAQPEENAGSSPEAFRQAMELIGRRSKPEVELTLKRLRQIHLADPGFLPAANFIGHCEVSMAMHRYDAPVAAGARARAMADDILAAHPQAAEALSVRGFVRAVIAGDRRGFAELDRAVQAEPRNWLLHYYRGFALAGEGQFSRGLADFEEAWAIAPNAVGIASTYAYVLHCAGQPERGLDLLQGAHEFLRLSPSANAVHAILASWLGRHDEAVAAGRRACEVVQTSTTLTCTLPYALARAGRMGEAAQEMAGIMAPDALPGAPAMLAPVHLALGDQARARKALRSAGAESCPYRHIQRFDPRLAALRG